MTPWTVTCQAPLSLGFSGQEYWIRVPFPSPGRKPKPEMKPKSPALAGGFFTTEPPGKPGSWCTPPKQQVSKVTAKMTYRQMEHSGLKSGY